MSARGACDAAGRGAGRDAPRAGDAAGFGAAGGADFAAVRPAGFAAFGSFAGRAGAFARAGFAAGMALAGAGAAAAAWPASGAELAGVFGDAGAFAARGAGLPAGAGVAPESVRAGLSVAFAFGRRGVVLEESGLSEVFSGVVRFLAINQKAKEQE